MIKFLATIKNRIAKPKVERCLYYGVLAVLSLYVFSIPSFANRIGFNYICYGLIAILIAIIVLYIFLFGIKRRFDKRTFLVVIFLISSFVGTIAFSHQFRGILTIFLLIISFYAIYLAMAIVDNDKLICWCITLAFFVFAIYYLIHYRESILNYRSYQYDEFRLGWDFENPNTVGSFMTLGLSLAAYIIIFGKGRIRFAFIVTILAFLLIGFTTGSRTFLISIVVITICLVLFKLKKHIVIALIGVAAILAISIVLINTVPFLATIKYRLEDTLKIFTDGVASGSTLERIVWQRYGFYLASRRILFGFGESGFAYASGVMTYTHGNFTEMLCDFGLIGFTLFYCFNIGPGFIALFTKKPNKEYIVTICAVMLLNGLLSVYYYDKCTYVIMALCYYFLDNAEPSFKFRKREVASTYYYEVNI